MESLDINKLSVYYALYTGKEAIKDVDGNETGEYRNGYSLPVNIRIRVSPNKGESNSQFFGSVLDYDSTMITTDSLPIDEYSILWVRSTPVLVNGDYPVGADGNLITGHTHTVVRVAKDINVSQYAIKKVSS